MFADGQAHLDAVGSSGNIITAAVPTVTPFPLVLLATVFPERHS